MNECWTIDKSALRNQIKDIKLNKPGKIGSDLFEMLCFKTQQKQNEVFYSVLVLIVLIENLHTINELCPILFW